MRVLIEKKIPSRPDSLHLHEALVRMALAQSFYGIANTRSDEIRRELKMLNKALTEKHRRIFEAQRECEGSYESRIYSNIAGS